MSLKEGLQNLAYANRGFNDTAALQARNYSEVSLPCLTKAIDNIDAIAKPQKSADFYIKEWEAYLAGQTEVLSPRIIRNLAWHPEVAIDDRFWNLITNSDRSTKSAKTIQGLVYSYHSKCGAAVANRWSKRGGQYFCGSEWGTKKMERESSPSSICRFW